MVESLELGDIIPQFIVEERKTLGSESTSLLLLVFFFFFFRIEIVK